jgi:hypothetical protein
MRQAITNSVIAALVLLTLARPSEGEIIRWRLTGTVSISAPEGLLPADLVAGADSNVLQPPDPDSTGGKPFVAYWSYDTSVADSLPESYAGKYVHPLADPLTVDYGLSVHIEGYVLRLDTSLEPYTVNVAAGQLTPPDFLFGAPDGIGTNHTNLLVPFEYNSPQVIHDAITLSFGDALNTTQEEADISSDALPLSLDPNDFDLLRIQISGTGEVFVGSSPPPSFFMQAWVHEITRVPEPAACGLACFGTLFLAWASRR